MTRRFVSHFCVGRLLLACGISTLCLAQSQTPQRSRVQMVRIKPDMLNEFIDLEKNEVVPALKKGGTKSRTVYQTAIFGNGFEFAIVTPFERFAEFDGDEAQFKALGATASARLGEKLRKCILDADSFLITRADDLSNLMVAATPPQMIVTARYRVAPGRMQEFETLIKADVLPGFRKAKMVLTVNHRGMGGEP